MLEPKSERESNLDEPDSGLTPRLLVVFGEGKPVLRLATQDELGGCGHWLHQERVQEFTDTTPERIADLPG